MSSSHHPSSSHPSDVLASDMDGTFIPLEGNDENRRDLDVLARELCQRSIELLYVTGRHFELAMEAVVEHRLPLPDWLICDVGTSLYHRRDGQEFESDPDYADHLEQIIRGHGVADLAQALTRIDGLLLQPDEKQGRFKLSYDCAPERLCELADRLLDQLDQMRAPYRVIPSVDPFTGGGLIDLLPREVSKAYALQWWVEQHGRSADGIMFAGDSGNDLAALSAGYRSIVVGNAPPAVVDEVTASHRAAGWTDRLFIASKPATSGVLQGLRHFICEARPKSA